MRNVRQASRARTAAGLAAACIITALLESVVSTQRQQFYPDDPIARAPESQDASDTQPYERLTLYELFYNLFVTSRHEPAGTRARNINTVDEVPDSSWFTNRIGTRPMTAEEIARGPIVSPPPDPSKWVLIGEKASGVQPGFTALDARGDTYFLQFDPKSNPEGATAAVVIATKIFWALGYNQVESHITSFDPKRATIDPDATLRRPSGARTPFTQDDVDAILEQVAQKADGTYRVIAGRLLPGKILGEFRYDGTRPDDPNDIVPHEHRRELRALRVFGAWTNLTDLKAANTLDSLITEGGRTRVRHYLQDVGSTFGMSNRPHEWDVGYEHFYQADAMLRRLWSFGFALSPWRTVDYEEYPSVGKFEGEVFDPRLWRPQTPTTAYMELRDDDAFWAARRVGAFTDELIRAAVHTGEFSNPAAEEHLADVLIRRRDKIEQVYLTAVNPIVEPRLDAGGRLSFTSAVDMPGDVTYHVVWSRFDNATGETQPFSETRTQSTSVDAPEGMPAAPDSFVAINISAESHPHPAWRRPIRTHFRRESASWKLVGLERLPEGRVPVAIVTSSSP